MLALKEIAKHVPGMRGAYEFARLKYQELDLRNKPVGDVFTEICEGNGWGGADSVSGLGSDLVQTRVVRRELPRLFRRFGIQTMLDIPCGDFHWMQKVELDGVDYTGADIVADLVEKNSRHETPTRRFRNFNLIEDSLPTVDLLFCRDCLVHLSYRDVLSALRNICASDSKYLLTTTFPGRRHNRDIATGQWRPLNLELNPFAFPPPLEMILEECTEGKGAYQDKSLGLWKVAAIRDALRLEP